MTLHVVGHLRMAVVLLLLLLLLRERGRLRRRCRRRSLGGQLLLLLQARREELQRVARLRLALVLHPRRHLLQRALQRRVRVGDDARLEALDESVAIEQPRQLQQRELLLQKVLAALAERVHHDLDPRAPRVEVALCALLPRVEAVARRADHRNVLLHQLHRAALLRLILAEQRGGDPALAVELRSCARVGLQHGEHVRLERLPLRRRGALGLVGRVRFQVGAQPDGAAHAARRGTRCFSAKAVRAETASTGARSPSSA